MPERTPPGELAEDLTGEQREQIAASLRAAVERLELAAQQGEIASQYRNDLETAEATLEALRKEVQTAQDEIGQRDPLSGEETLVGEAAMFATEQSLLRKESELRALQAELDGYRTQLAEIGARA